MKIEYRLGAGAIVDESIEGREERQAGRNRVVWNVGVCPELSSLEPHAERAPLLLFE